MNRCYRLVFNRSTQVWQVVSEIAKSHSKSAAIILLPLLSLVNQSYTLAEPAINALPTGGQVVAGQSAITQNGNQLTIVQGSDKSIINWQSYKIGSHAEVNYIQNNANAISLNRVITGDPSAIFGKLNSNGQVWLINPNGVLFGQGAQVNVGGLLATTLNIADDDFMAGKYQFTGSNGSVVNMGAISASQGGYVAMLAPEVRNEGVISAMQGTVAMAAGNAITLDFSGSGLINVQVDSANINTLLENKHLIKVGNGQVLMSTKAADGLITSVINNTGKIEANSMVSDGGVIRLAGAKTVINSGDISATSATQKGGSVHLLGDIVGMFNAGSVNVSGKTGGGTILVGGDFQGNNSAVQNATKTYVSKDAKLIADATESGDGGKVIVWANDIARYYGSTSAKGGAVAGNGGFVEISGKRLLNFLGSVDLSAVNGVGGNLLLDPANITIGTGLDTNTLGFTAPANLDITEAFADDASLNSFFDVTALTGSFAGITAGSTITLQATNDITIANAFDVATATGSANNSLLLEANNNINVNAALSSTGTGSLTLRADADNNGSGDLAINAAITSGIGGVNLSGANINGAGSISTVSTNQNGGNVSITSTAAINLAGTIGTTGGASTTVGRNAGNVTLSAGTSVSTNAITANGSNGNISGGLVGGNAGLINITANSGIALNGTVIALGGAASAGSAKGGDAGTINIRNLDAGSAATGNISGLLVRAAVGAAKGIGAGGLAGGITIINQADSGDVTFTNNLLTSGALNGAGGNVNVSSDRNVNLAGININGNNSTAGFAGTNSGNLTITGVNRTISGAINANGGGGVGSTDAAGNSGIVTITGSGTLSTAGINVQTGTVSGAGLGGVAGSVNLSASSMAISGTINTAPGSINGLGGNVNLITTGGLSSSVASINANNFGAISINAADILTVSGVISGTDTTLTKSGIGKVILTGANTFTGAVNVNAGVLNLQNATAAGTAAGGVTVANGAALELQGGITIGAEALTLNGTGIAGAGALRSISGTNSWNGAITLASDTQINTDAGTLTIGANVDGAAKNLTISGAADTLINGVIGTTTGALNKLGAGNLTLVGSNTYTGATNVNAGTLLISASERINDASALAVASGATFNLNNFTETVGSIAGTGNILMGTGSLFAGADNSSTTFSGVISGLAGSSFNKIGLGTLTLSGNNTYDGVTNVLNGTLLAASANALGTTAGASIVTSGKTLNVNNVTLAAESINLSSTAALTGTGAATVAGNITAADNSQVGTTTAGSTLTINGILSSTAGNTLDIIGAGSVVANNTANNVDIVKITSANNVSLRDIDSMQFSTTPSNLTGTLTAVAANNVTLQAGGGITSTAGDILFTSNAFINNAGANALSTVGGRWVVHTATVAGNTYGALSSGNQAIFGRALGVATAETGNRYVFAASPTLNITSSNQTKSYGQDASALVANAFTATTFVDAAAFGGVFTQDTIANSLAGSATSAGSAITANVASYAIDVTPISSINGYTLSKSNAGNLSVNAAVVNLAGSRVYDGTTVFDASAFSTFATGVNGETLNVSGSGGSVASKNAGAAQTLTTGALALANGTGLASNYTLANGSHTGTITAATLNLSAVTDSKVYDGNTNSAAAVARSGLVAGDSITGLSQRFSNKNVLGLNGSTLNVNAGYTVNDGNGGNNYIVAAPTSAMGTINQAGLTVAANNASKVQGTANPAFTSTISGFVGGDTSAVLAGMLDYNTLANTASPAGTYAVTPFGVSTNNYAISFIDGALEVSALVTPPTLPPVLPPVSPIIPPVNALNGGNISTFNNATTRPEQAVQTCQQQGASAVMINGLDEFGLDDVDYQSSISQPQVGGVIANGLAGVSCSIL